MHSPESSQNLDSVDDKIPHNTSNTVHKHLKLGLDLEKKMFRVS